MKRVLLTITVACTALMFGAVDVIARGPGGGGAKGGEGEKGGGEKGGGEKGGAAGPRPAPSAGHPPTSNSGSRPPTSSAKPPTPSTNSRPPGGGEPSASSRSGSGTSKGNTGGGGSNSARSNSGSTGNEHPTSSQLNSFLDVPKSSSGASAGMSGRSSGGAAADFLHQDGAQSPASGSRTTGANPTRYGSGAGASTFPETNRNEAGAGGMPGSSKTNRQNLAQNRPGKAQNNQQSQQNRDERANEVRNQMANDESPNNFWRDNPAWAAWGVTSPYRAATWGAMSSWGAFGEPVYYNYGTSTYVQNGMVYSGGQQVATEAEYAQQAQNLAASAPAAPAQSTDWMSLGVFAMTQDGDSSGAPPTLFMQLVVNKQGVISGTFNNKTTGQTQTLEGMVDKDSQRAAWGVQGQDRPIVETGIANLTQDSTPVLVHFSDGPTQQWLLVRLKDPQGAK